MDKEYVYNTSHYSIILESYGNTNGGNADELAALGKIRMSDGNLVDGIEFVDLVNSAIAYFKNTQPYEYKYIKNCSIIYLLDDTITDTMCVDSKMVYYINVGFLYDNPPHGLGMNALAVFRILYHEAMHSMLAHIPRMLSYNENQEIKANWKDLNIAGDLEVNGIMVGDNICPPDFWKQIGGCYSKDVAGLPMETIMKRYKNVVEQCKKNPQPQAKRQNKKKEKIPTSSEWKNGHRDGRELIRKLYVANNRNAIATINDIEKMMEKYGGDMTKVADELKRRFSNN